MAPVEDTLRLVALLLGCVFGFSWIVLGLASRESLRYSLNFFVANLCVAVGIVLVTQRASVTNFYTAQLADWLGVAGVTAFASGVLLLSEVRASPRWVRVLPVVAEIALTFWVPADNSSYFYRAAVFNVTTALTAFLAFESCMRNAGVAGGLFIRSLAATPFLLAGILFAMRGVKLAFDWHDGQLPMDAYRSYANFLWGYIAVQVIANISNGGMVVAKLLTQIKRLAARDSLTGALNRRALMERMEACIRVFKRHGRPLSCTLFDLDHFKSINDQYSHEAGDAALIHAASLVREQLRAVDTLGRYGGEEFVVVMPDTSLAEAHQVVERIRIVLEATPFVFRGTEISLSASFGVAALRPDESQSEWLHRVDLSMYEAKRQGRNCVVVSDLQLVSA